MDSKALLGSLLPFAPSGSPSLRQGLRPDTGFDLDTKPECSSLIGKHTGIFARGSFHSGCVALWLRMPRRDALADLRLPKRRPDQEAHASKGTGERQFLRHISDTDTDRLCRSLLQEAGTGRKTMRENPPRGGRVKPYTREAAD